MNVVLLACGGALALAVLAGLGTARSGKPTLWALGALLSVSPLALTGFGALADDTLVKAGMIATIALLWVRFGVRIRWPVGVMLGGLGLALLVSTTRVVPSISVDPALAAKAFAGYFLTVAALMVRWRREHVPDVLQVLVALPALSIGLGAVLQVAVGWPVISGGRLGGALIGPHLALLSIAAAVAALAGLVVTGGRRWAVWLLADCAIAFLTLTRGALIAAAILLLTLGAWTITARRTAPRPTLRAARIVFWSTVAVGAGALPLILARNAGNAYEGSFNTSGREQAWPFYLSLSAGSPVFGRGLGYANIANALLHPFGVQTEFQSPHNEYIHLWVDGGLLLAVPFFAGLVALGIVVARASGRPVLAIGVLTATLAYSFVDNTFSTPQFAVPFGLAVAALLSTARSVQRSVRGLGDLVAARPDPLIHEHRASPAR